MPTRGFSTPNCQSLNCQLPSPNHQLPTTACQVLRVLSGQLYGAQLQFERAAQDVALYGSGLSMSIQYFALSAWLGVVFKDMRAYESEASSDMWVLDGALFADGADSLMDLTALVTQVSPSHECMGGRHVSHAWGEAC